MGRTVMTDQPGSGGSVLVPSKPEYEWKSTSDEGLSIIHPVCQYIVNSKSNFSCFSQVTGRLLQYIYKLEGDGQML